MWIGKMSDNYLQELEKLRGKQKLQDERLELLEATILRAKLAVPWMVKTLRHATDELHEGNYSDELKHAIAVEELLKKI